VLLGVITGLQVGVVLCFVDILVGFNGLGVVSQFQKCNLGAFCKNFDIMKCLALM